MSEDFDTEYDFSGDSSLDPDQKNVGGNKSDWLKFTSKGQIVRGSFVHFQTVDYNAVRVASNNGQKKLARDEQVKIAKAALAKKAESLSKQVGELTAVDKLDLTSAHFKTFKAHYQEGVGYVLSRLGKDGVEADQVWKRLPEPKTYITTLLLVYPTDTEGNINLESFMSQVKQHKVKILPWRFSTKVYDTIWKLQDGLRADGQTLASKDFKLECDNPQYQGVTIQTAGPATWQKNPQVANTILTSAHALYDKLNPFREMTTEQLRAKLGIGGASSAADNITSEDFQDLLDSV